MEITVLHDSGITGFMMSVTRYGEVYMTDVASMVRNVLAEAGGHRISRLNILDHGNTTHIALGDDHISISNLRNYEPMLARLKGRFAEDGFVHLQHCHIGQNQPLLLELARIWGTTVYAGTGRHNPVFRFNFGDYVRCDPLPIGCETDVLRPGAPGPADMEPRYLGGGAFLGRDGLVRQGFGPK